MSSMLLLRILITPFWLYRKQLAFDSFIIHMDSEKAIGYKAVSGAEGRVDGSRRQRKEKKPQSIKLWASNEYLLNYGKWGMTKNYVLSRWDLIEHYKWFSNQNISGP